MKEILQHGKVRLRPLEPEDIEILYQWENDSTLWSVSNTLVPFSRYLLKKYIEASHQDIYEQKQLRLIIQNLSEETVGIIDLFDFDPYHLRAGIGILIHSTEARRKGYASDAIQTICGYAKEVLGMHQLYANIPVANEASIILFKKAGFEQAGIKKAWLKRKTGWEDEVMVQKILKP